MRHNTENEVIFIEIDSIVDEYQDTTPYKKNDYELAVCLLDIRNETRWYYLAKLPSCILHDYSELISSYLESFNVPRYCKASLEVVQVQDEEYKDGQFDFIPIIKTRYIRLLQRKWKSFYKGEMDTIKKNCNPRSLLHRECYGRFQYQIPYLHTSVY